MIKKPLFLFVFFLGATVGQLTADEPLWSVRMAESVMTRHPNGYGNWDYVTGTVLRGFEELWRRTGDERYFNYIQKTVDRAVMASGNITDYRLSDYNLDEIREGCDCLFKKPSANPRRWFLAQATISLADVAGRPLYGRAVLYTIQCHG